ncbi:13617_t:CDS:2 [Gigaspora margarita]|uniref:13617_t:CDS:1 n=3 Tax=Gigaspora margarita TaxID=4874 RepID=A0ABN7VFK4_GIGMA|nr:Ribokinase-like protein [Gigaspora margarita]CAG8760284.1 13617_t:CDS:2 [Gigaspora margarita]
MGDPLLCSLSQCIIDDIKFSDGTIQKDVLGGGGVYATYGMRIWFSRQESQRIAYSFHSGYDFPLNILQSLLVLNISLTQIWHSNLPSIRGINTFKTANQRVFAYQTPPIGTVPSDLPSSYLNAKIFHFICSSIWASQHVTDILRLRDKRLPPPIFVWEPIPEGASKENIQSCIEAMKMVDVVSPNHEEAAALLGLITEDDEDDEKFLTEEMLICMADKFLKHQIGPHGNGSVVIRASYKGCLVATKEKKEIIPAYWTSLKDGNRNPHVVDVTGAGNAFCGGFMVGLLKSNFDVFEAALYGAVSASFTVEQFGTPRLSFDERGNEIWNAGDTPSVRLQKLRLRVKEKLKEVLKVKLKERIDMKKMHVKDHNGIN